MTAPADPDEIARRRREAVTHRSRVVLAAIAERDQHEAETSRRLALRRGLSDVSWSRMAGEPDRPPPGDLAAQFSAQMDSFIQSINQAKMAMEELRQALLATAAAGPVN